MYPHISVTGLTLRGCSAILSRVERSKVYAMSSNPLPTNVMREFEWSVFCRWTRSYVTWSLGTFPRFSLVLPGLLIFGQMVFQACNHPFVLQMDYAFQTELHAIIVLNLVTTGNLQVGTACIQTPLYLVTIRFPRK